MATGIGVAGAAGGTQRGEDDLGDAAAELFHVAGGVATNTEQGAGMAVANAVEAVDDTAEATDKKDDPCLRLSLVISETYRDEMRLNQFQAISRCD